MNLLLVGNIEFQQYFKKLGYKVFTSSFSEQSDFPISNLKFKLSEICKKNKIDVLLQVESLGKREIILDLPEINCLKIFYAVDIHLNYFWQKLYAQNFNILISSQKNYSEKYKRDTGNISYWLPWGINPVFVKEFIPHKSRKHLIAFIGTIDSSRVKRKNIIDIIKSKFDIFIAGNTPSNRLSTQEVIQIYRNSKIVINESINSEINFRYFEATSSGALLFTEKIDNGEETLFKEDKEFIRFNQENLIEKLDFFIKNPEISEKIALTGYNNTINHHTISKRVETLSKIILENLSIKTSKNSNKLIEETLFFIILRGIGDQSYVPICKNLLFSATSFNELFILAQFAFIKKNSIEDAINFIGKHYTNYPSNLLLANIVLSFIENNEIERALNLLKSKSIESGIVKLIENLIKEQKDYLIGFVNYSKFNVILTGFELITFMFKKYYNNSLKSRKLNYLAAKILMNNRNFSGAIWYLLNNVRYYPDDILSRKMLAKCFYEVYSLELYTLETLKIMILEREFGKFKTHTESSLNQKKEAILDIITHSHNKKLIKDITVKLEEFIN